MGIYEKLSDIQMRLKAPKSQYNNFGKYNYRNCEDILEAVKPLLNEHKLFINIADTIELVGTRYYVKATVTVSDGETEVKSTAYAREEEAKKGMDGSQITGAASSYARKYALNGMFAIDDTKDADNNNNTKKNAESEYKCVQCGNPFIATKDMTAKQVYDTVVAQRGRALCKACNEKLKGGAAT